MGHREKLIAELAAIPRRELTLVNDRELDWQILCANKECTHLLNVPKKVGKPSKAGTVWEDVVLESMYPRWCPPCGFEANLRVHKAAAK